MREPGTGAALFDEAPCGGAVAELAAAEEQRTLVLRKLAHVQQTVRAPGQRMLSPLELSVGITRSESAAKVRVELDGRIAKLRRALAAHNHALAFWKWCRTTLLPDGATTSAVTRHAGCVGDSRQRLKALHVKQLIRDLGLEIREPSGTGCYERAAMPT